MKKSVAVTLVLSGSLLAGCGRRAPVLAESPDPSVVVTNNTYVPGRGYYHASYGQWYPYPYNHYIPSMGYYYGGTWSRTPDSSPAIASRPVSVPRGETTTSHSSFLSRGGFGGHSSSSS
jgi:uncharacterized protein YgiB involved in biofilm formation